MALLEYEITFIQLQLLEGEVSGVSRQRLQVRLASRCATMVVTEEGMTKPKVEEAWADATELLV